MINEENLERIVRNTIQETLNELTPHQKERNVKDVERFFRKGKGGHIGIRSIVVLTSENPDSRQAESGINKKYRHSLLADIKNGGYAYVPAMGKFGNVERPYAVFNMSVDTAKTLCGKYQQTSFVFSSLNEDGTVHSEYYEKNNPTLPYDRKSNDYVMKDSCDDWEDKSEANDYFTVIGNRFKYSIPFKIFDSVNETICENIQRIISVERKRGDNSITEEKILDYTINGVGQSPYLWRQEIYKGL